MKRQYCFRAKRVDNGEWIYGQLGKVIGGYNIRTENRAYAVKQETIGQWTGLKDADDRDIYEDDIISPKDVLRRNDIHIIQWSDDDCRYILVSPYSLAWVQDFDTQIAYECYKIGNIHDTPELIKKDRETEVQQ